MDKISETAKNVYEKKISKYIFITYRWDTDLYTKAGIVSFTRDRFSHFQRYVERYIGTACVIYR